MPKILLLGVGLVVLLFGMLLVYFDSIALVSGYGGFGISIQTLVVGIATIFGGAGVLLFVVREWQA